MVPRRHHYHHRVHHHSPQSVAILGQAILAQGCLGWEAEGPATSGSGTLTWRRPRPESWPAP
eukprot:9440949-Lingulodinium_polyedra.AAC.1